MTNHKHTRDTTRGHRLSDYWPLVCLILIAAVSGAAIASPHIVLVEWMHYFMGFFLCSFAMLKLFDLNGFANGFEMYDLLAKRFRGYAYVYPLIELALGLSYFAFWQQALTYTATIIVMGFSSLGVIRALIKGLDIYCPCMGSVLKVPLSTVTLTEDLGMLFMAAAMLAHLN